LSYQNTSLCIANIDLSAKAAQAHWAIRHKDDDRSRAMLADETGYQLFRNTIRRRSKNLKAEITRIPKNREKIWCRRFTFGHSESWGKQKHWVINPLSLLVIGVLIL
jgi:hypothetical protein